MTQLQAEVNSLSASYPVKQDHNTDRHLERLNQMARFYSNKAPEAPTQQGFMFKGFVAALLYAYSVILEHRDLTIKLAELAEGDEDGSTTN